MNIRNKGQNGEREICDMLNKVYCEILKDLDRPIPIKKDQPFQRNQLQSAVGGSDISNPFKLDIEVKRQENLSVNSWWQQCIDSAERNGGIPVLIYRQNRSKWRILMQVQVPFNDTEHYTTRAELSLESFSNWLYFYMLERV